MLLKNVASMSGVNIARAALQFVTNMLVAAFVNPSDFGLVSFAMPFIVLATILTDLGLTSALVQHTTLDRRITGASFTLMLALGVVLTSVLILIAPLVESHTHLVGLAPIMIGMSVSVLFTMSAIVPRAVLERRLEYSRIAIVEGAALLFSWVLGAGLIAFAGMGIWGLVVYQLTGQAIRASAFAIISRSELVPNLRWNVLRPLISFGGWILATNLINFIARNADNLLIGSYLGAAALGIYGLAFQFMTVPLLMISWPASAILFASISHRARQTNLSSSAAVASALIFITSIVTIPGMLFLTFGAALPFSKLLSAQWSELSVIVAILAPIGAVQSIATYGGAVFLANGESRLQFILTLVHTIALVCTILVSLQFGLRTLVICYGVEMIAYCIFALVLMCKRLKLGASDFAKLMIPSVTGTACGLIAAGMVTRFQIDSWSLWIVGSAVYFLTIGVVYAIFRKRIANSIKWLTRKPPILSLAEQ
jgi:O-antigen/teichoic acid export membrane protein